MTDYREQYSFTQLVLLSIQGKISPEQIKELESQLRGNRVKIREYLELLNIYTEMSEIGSVEITSEENQFDSSDLVRILAETEKNAPEVLIEELVENSEVTTEEKHKARSESRIYRIFKKTVYMAAVLMIMFIVYANIFPPQLSEEVATVVDQFEVEWNVSSVKLKTKERILTNQAPYKIEKGIVKFTYDEGVDIIVEGPAEFTVKKRGVDLAYGRLYSYVSEIGHGFTVDTPNNRFVDLGTEFGVQVSKFGNSELHVMTGKVQLFAGGSKEGKKTKLVSEKEAILYDSSTGMLKPIEYRAEDFARAIDSTSQFVWRGQDLNLADIIAGGNGLGSGKRQAAIDAANGKMIPWGLSTDRQGDGRYISVDDSRYIDGVFVPDGGDGPITVSSENHTWNAPDTTGEYKFNIASSLRIVDDVSGIPVGSSGSDVMLSQSLQGTKSVHTMLPEAWSKSDSSQHSSIFMHSNLGITYDLDELRSVVPGQRLSSFKSTFGVSEQYMRLEGVDLTGMHIDLWVLIDGEIKYSAKDINATKLLDIDIEIAESDSFLSLVVTQSIDGFKYDWGLFVDSVVTLESMK